MTSWGALHPPTTHMQFRRVVLALVGDTVLHRALKSDILACRAGGLLPQAIVDLMLLCRRKQTQWAV